VCDEFWLVGRGEIKPFDGDLDDYQRYLLEESKRLREEAKASDAAAALPHAIAATVAPMVPMASETKSTAPFQNRTAEQKKEDALLRQQKSALAKPLKKSIEKADVQLLKLQSEKAALENKLTQALAPSEIAETGKQLKSVNNALDELEAQWLAWSEELEKIEQSA
jgi:ATP-binding cassette subfamily F protein 3